MNNTARYNRQIILPEIGEDGQFKLSKAKVLLIGAGGLGVAILTYLAAAGVGEMVLLMMMLSKFPIYSDRSFIKVPQWENTR